MISEFKEKYRWLSNFSPVIVKFRGRNYPSVEHAYMSTKSHDKKWKDFCADPNNSAAEVKKASKDIELSDYWELEKLNVMWECLEKKFTQQPYKSLLLDTGNQNIQEGNYWGDEFWGVNLKTEPNKGENHLGRMIMQLRDKIRQGEYEE